LVVLVESDEQFIRAYRGLAEMGEGFEGMAVVIDGLPVEIFPTTISGLYKEAMLHAVEIELPDNIRVKVVTPEYLILFALQAWRYQDKLRIKMLRDGDVTDAEEVERLIHQFDQEGALWTKYQSVT